MPVVVRTEVPSPMTGIGLKVLSALAFTLMAAGVKWLGPRFPAGEVVFFRSAFALVPLLVWLGLIGHIADSVKTDNVLGHVVRGLIGSAGMFSGFAALSYLPLTEAVAIGYAAPLITVLLAAVFLKERVRAYRWSAVGFGLCGVVVMLLPQFDIGGASVGGSSLGAVFGLCGAFCAACATIQVRRLTASERTGAIVLYFSLLTTALGLATIMLGWTMPTPTEFLVFVLVGILGGIGQILLTQSFRFADASLIAPFDYTTMIWSVAIGWTLFGQLPHLLVAVGGAIVVAAGVFVIWREARLGLARQKHLEIPSQRGH